MLKRDNLLATYRVGLGECAIAQVGAVQLTTTRAGTRRALIQLGGDPAQQQCADEEQQHRSQETPRSSRRIGRERMPRLEEHLRVQILVKEATALVMQF